MLNGEHKTAYLGLIAEKCDRIGRACCGIQIALIILNALIATVVSITLHLSGWFILCAIGAAWDLWMMETWIVSLVYHSLVCKVDIQASLFFISANMEENGK